MSNVVNLPVKHRSQVKNETESYRDAMIKLSLLISRNKAALQEIAELFKKSEAEFLALSNTMLDEISVDEDAGILKSLDYDEVNLTISFARCKGKQVVE